MANYSFWALGESHITVSGGVSLDGITQGDGSHLVGKTITLEASAWEEIAVKDGGSDTNFDDSDGNQRLDGTQSFDGISYGHNTRIEAEYEILLQDPATGLTYRALAVNVNNSSPAYGTVEGLAFVDEFPPVGVELTVISAKEGPSGGSAVDNTELAAPPCFTPGTRILTPEGARAVETLEVGDMVLTRDRGAQEIRWIGRCPVARGRMQSEPQFRPVRIRAGAFGERVPERDMLVSQQHRILIRGWRAELFMGAEEVLVAAVHLVNGETVQIARDVEMTEYIHLQFDHHEIVVSDGLETESLNPGPISLSTIPDESRQELAALFPEIDLGRQAALSSARMMAKRHEAALLGMH